jgi:hypothetical protein
MRRIALPVIPLPAGRLRSPRASLGLVVVAASLAIGCGDDAVTMPERIASECADQPGCRATDATPVDPIVFAVVADARERLVPMLDDAAARRTLTSTFQSLDQALHANQSGVARARLGELYGQLDRVRMVVDGVSFDLPDVAAIRLALVPVANALGVKAL